MKGSVVSMDLLLGFIGQHNNDRTRRKINPKIL